MTRHPEKFCRWCGTLLVQGDTENPLAWEKRMYCNKSHAAKHTAEKRREKR